MGDVIRPDFGGPGPAPGEAQPEPEPAPGKPDYFLRIAARAAVYEPSLEERQAEVRQKVQELRRGRLERAKPAIRPQVLEAIVRGELYDTPALDWVRRWRHYQKGRQLPSKNYLAMLGLTGRGKTAAAAWLLAEEGGYYVTADELRRKVTSPAWKERDWLDHFCGGGCVVIDDLGTEFDVPGANLAIFEVVNRRLAMPRAFTVLTGNLLSAEFRARYDHRTIRRIEDAGAVVEVEGDDLRAR